MVILQEGEKIRIVGQKQDGQIFVAERIMPWERPGMPKNKFERKNHEMRINIQQLLNLLKINTHMKNKKLFNLGLVVAGVVALTGITMASAALPERGQGNRNFDPSNLPAEKQAHFEEMKLTKEAVKTAVENNDYTAWVDAHGDGERGQKMLEIINESNFDRLVEMHGLMQAGDREGAKAIAEELGLPDKGEFKKGHGKMGKRGPMKDVNGDGVCDKGDRDQE